MAYTYSLKEWVFLTWVIAGRFFIPAAEKQQQDNNDEKKAKIIIAATTKEPHNIASSLNIGYV